MRKRALLPAILGVALVGALAWVRAADPYPVQALRDIAFDGFNRLAPRPDGGYAVRVIDIDEASLAEIGQWPWPRNFMAELTTRLTALGAATVVFDGLFPEPDRLSPNRIAASLGEGAVAVGAELPDYDAMFAEALARSPSVLGFSISPDASTLPEAPKASLAIVGPAVAPTVPLMTGAVVPLPDLLAAAHGLGGISLEAGGTIEAIRRVPLLWSNGTRLFPALSIETLRVAFGVTTVVHTDPTGSGTVQGLSLGPLRVPTTPTGELWLYYQRQKPDLYIPAKDILGPDWQSWQAQIAGHIVLIGTSAAGLLDIRGTPMGETVPGVEIHVQAIQQMLSSIDPARAYPAFLQRADWTEGLELFGFVLIGLIMVAVIMLLGPLAGLGVITVLLTALAAASWLAFTREGLLIDPSFPIIGSFIVYTAITFFRFLITDSDKRKIRSAFGYYVSPELLTEIERNRNSLKLGGEIRPLSIMFSDVRNFTTLSEGLPPADLVNLLNTLFQAMGTQITDRMGTIDKFIGDAIMAFWNAPVDVDRHALRACESALAMRKRLVEMNETDAFRLRVDKRSIDQLAIGIGIASGEALVGNLGLETRFDYSCIGDTVNVASRVEGACKTVGYDIVVVEATRLAAPELAFLDAGALSLKGKTRREPIFILVGDAAFATTPAFKALSEAHDVALAALRGDGDVDEAIRRCVSLISFPDPLLDAFYRKLKTRRSDFDANAPVMASADAH